MRKFVGPALMIAVLAACGRDPHSAPAANDRRAWIEERITRTDAEIQRLLSDKVDALTSGASAETNADAQTRERAEAILYRMRRPAAAADSTTPSPEESRDLAAAHEALKKMNDSTKRRADAAAAIKATVDRLDADLDRCRAERAAAVRELDALDKAAGTGTPVR